MQENTESDKPKISVIIPVYNTDQYVREAVESIMNQTLREIEIIVINDGSTDNSLAVVEELTARDKRVRVFSQANQGLSRTRNTGLSHAQGKYIYFMDSDDILEADAMEICYRQCEENQLDFVFFDAVSFADGKVENTPVLKYKRTDKFENKVYGGCEAFDMQLQNNAFTSSACLSVIRKEFLLKNSLQFYPGIIHEDQLFTVMLYLQAARTACIPRTFFHRRIRSGSIMTCRFSTRNLDGYLTVTREVLLFRKQTSNQETKTIIDRYLSQMLNAVAWQAHTLPLHSRLRIASLFFFIHRKYVSTKSIGVLLAKSIIHHSK